MKSFSSTGSVTDLYLTLSDVDAEFLLLASIAVSPDSMGVYVFDSPTPVKTDYFTVSKHRVLFDILEHLWHNEYTIDPESISVECRERDVEEQLGVTFIADLFFQQVAYSGGLQFLETVRRLYVCRTLVAMSSTLTTLAINAGKDKLTPVQVVERAQEIIDEHFQTSIPDGLEIVTAKAAAAQGDDLINKSLNNDGLIGIPTGLVDFDSQLGGLYRRAFSIWLADTGIGKTQLALKLALTTALAGEPVLYVSLEMPADILAVRLNSYLSGVAYSKLLSGNLTEEELRLYHQAKDVVADLPIYFEQSFSISAPALRRYVLKRSKHQEYGLVVVDYLQLMLDDSDNDVRGLRQAMRNFLLLSRKLPRTHVAVLSGVTRGAVSGPDKRPTIHAGYGSGFIEKDPDYVFGLYRHQNYYPDNEATKGKGEFIVLKSRNGRLFTVPVSFQNGCWQDTVEDDDSILNSFLADVGGAIQ